MKILQVMAGAKHGGAETAFVDTCLALHDAGEDIEVVTRAHDERVPRLTQAGIPVHTLPFGGRLDVFSSWKLASIIKRFQPVIVQTWMGRATQKTPNWSALNTPQRYLVVARLGGYYALRNFKSADYFVANTPHLKDYIAQGGIKADRIRHINNFAPAPEAESTPPIVRADMDTPDDATVLLALARLHPVKGLDVLIRSVAGLPDMYVRIAGEGDERAALQALAAQEGVADRVKFLGWRDDCYGLICASDIVVVPSREEPFGNVFVQAWAAQKPVIVSNALGPKQFCVDGEDCLMVPREDAGALAAAITRLAGDKALQSKIIERGYERYLNEFTKEKTVSAYLEFYLDILRRENLL